MKKAYLTVFTVTLLLLSQTAQSETVNVDLNTSMQTIRGFGGMNFPRWIGTLTNAQVDTAFGNGPGQIGLTIMRIDVPPNTSNWSAEVPAAQRAINNHGAIVFATPWSPPASMKTNNNLIQGELKTDSYDDYANHLTDFVNYMSSNGAPLFAISVQNEPDWLPDYESCGWSGAQMQTFLNNNASVIPTRVIAPETVHYKEDYVSAVAASPECDIVAVHAYGGTITYFSDKEYWMTEHYTDSTTNANEWPNALNVGEEIHNCMTANMSGYIWWYIRRSYGPIDESGNITKRGYCMSHFAKFARPGYTRVDATANPSAGVYVTAYTSDSNLVIVAVNQNSSSSDVTFSLSGGIVSSYTKYETSSSNSLSNMGSVGSTDTLAAYSINTYVGTISFEDDFNSPEPNIMTWDEFPTAINSSSITMTASTASDASPPVLYYFECTTDGDFNSIWQTNTTYIASGLDPSTEYSFKVKARDSSPNQNETDWSSTESAMTDPPDYMPPTPDPMTWSSAPTATGASSITMTASTAYDISGVEYYFDCLSTGGHDSDWQDSPVYIDNGLTASTSYTYRVQARDKSLNQNATDWSSSLAATTQTPPANIELLGSWTTGLNHSKESGYNRALIFIAHAEENGTISLTSVTYGGQPMTKIIDQVVGTTYRAYVAAFILDEAGVAAATSGTFVPSWSATPDYVAYSSAFLQNANQTVLIGASAGNNSASSTPNPIVTTALATEDGDMVILGATSGNSGSYTLQGGFIEGNDQSFDNTATGVTGYKSATGANETPSAQHSGPNRQVIIGFVVKAGSPPDAPPAAPTGLVATAGNQTISLDWNDNGEADLAGYNVYRSTTQGSGYSKINGSIVINSYYTDSPVDNWTPYYYVVTAVDDGSNESGNSNEANATADFQNCSDVLASPYRLVSDIAGNCYVDINDLAIIVQYWLETDCASYNNCDGADLGPDGNVNFFDFSDFALDWLNCNDPQDENCTKNWLTE